MARLTVFWWSPDDRRIAVQRTDESPVGVVTRAAIGATGTKVFDQRYPAAGTDNAIRSEEHTSELQSLMRNSYAVFCLQNTNKHTLIKLSITQYRHNLSTRPPHLYSLCKY